MEAQAGRLIVLEQQREDLEREIAGLLDRDDDQLAKSVFRTSTAGNSASAKSRGRRGLTMATSKPAILGRVHVLSSLDGGCSGGVTHSSDRLSPQATWHGGMSSYPRVIRWFAGCAYETYTVTLMGQPHLGIPFRTVDHRLVVLPYAYLAAAFAAAPAVVLLKRVRGRRRRDKGLCRACGYDLRATPDRCPECGAVARAAGTAA